MGPEPGESVESAVQRRFAKLIANVEDTITLIDGDGVVHQTSGLYKPILGYPSEFWASRSIFDLLHPDDAERVLAMRESVLADPQATVTGEFRVRAADGNFAPLMVHAVNRLDDPEVRAIVITSRNISEEKALLENLARARDEALLEVELRTRLMATVSHELRNPIHAMAGMAELLATSDLPQAAAALANTLRRHIEGLSTVVDDLLDTSRLGAGAMALSLRPTAVRPMIDDVVALARLGVAGRPLVVAADVSPDVPAAVMADPARVRQVLINLVTNAVKFTPRGRVDVLVRWRDGMLIVDVRDTGVGITDDDLDAVFEPFATGANAGVASGAGLGLAIVRQLVDLMGGTIEVASPPGSGTTFTVVLPVAVADEAEADTAGALITGPNDANATTVLVVEDDEVNQLLAMSQLNRLGLRGVVVGSGEAAVELFREGDAPEIVLMDFLLPGLDGIETTRRLRALETDLGGRAVIIGVTASALASDRAAAAEAGMDDFLSKPVSLTDLSQALERWLPESMPFNVGPAGSPAVIDVTVLESLADDLGSVDVVVDLVRTFLNELHGRRTLLSAAAEVGDVTAARAAAHTLKSSALLLGAIELGRACQQFETIERVDDLRLATADVVQRSTHAARWLQNWLTRRPARR